MQSLRCLTAKVAIDNGFNLIHERNMRPLACCRKPELPFVVESESVARRSAVIDPIRKISVDFTKRVIDKYCTTSRISQLNDEFRSALLDPKRGFKDLYLTAAIVWFGDCRADRTTE